jgi:hypothetical protein
MYRGDKPVGGGWADYPITGSPGHITFPNDPMMTGRWTMTFCLVAAGRVVDGTCQTLELALTGRR